MKLEDAFKYSKGKLYWKYSPKYDVFVGAEAGSLRSDGYWEICLENIRYLRHRVIYYLHTGEWPKLIDHKDRDINNDKFENLRAASRSLNGHNSTVSTGVVPYRGVSLNNYGNFVTYIKINRKRKYLGTFKSAEEASQVYETARQEVVKSAK